MSIAPTILIGLGGIGSEIVDRVYGKVPTAYLDKVTAHAFDTNVNDISKRENLNGRITQTSATGTVGRLLHTMPDSVNDWFPGESLAVRSKLLTEGAGQIRAVSRLAYKASIENGSMNTLEAQLTRLFMVDGNKFNQAPRIFIISSLAGGTGAGLFLQTAFYLRDMMLNKFHRNCFVRGMFILPDILVKTGALPQDQISNIYTNAYACIKELNAVTQFAVGTGSGKTANIELEYKPNQVDNYGNSDILVKQGFKPYDACFVLDFENAQQKNLVHIENYFNQAVEIAYTQLFTPISQNVFSIEDNDILKYIGSGGKNYFASACVATLSYPYDDIVDYCANAWLVESISDNWLKIDKLYTQEIAEYEKSLANGIVLDRPKLPERYMWYFEHFAKGDTRIPFFAALSKSVLISQKDENHGDMADGFIYALDEEVKRLVREDSTLQDAFAMVGVRDELMKNPEAVRNEVTTCEEMLIELKGKVYKFIEEAKTFLINNVLFKDVDAPGCVSGSECSLNTWIIKKSEMGALHPVAVRYTLYRILSIIEKILFSLKEENMSVKNAIDYYDKIYDLPETEDVVETAVMRINLALGQSWFSKPFKGNSLKSFAEEYSSESAMQAARLRTYAEKKLYELVLSKLSELLKELTKDYEIYFGSLNKVMTDTLNEKNLLAIKHEKLDDMTKIFIQASPEEKKNLWGEIRNSCDTNTIPVDISKELYVNQYLEFCKKNSKTSIDKFSFETKEKVDSIARIKDWCRSEVRKRSAIDYDIIEAVAMEAKAKGLDYSAYLTDKVAELTRRSVPLASVGEGNVTSKYWGINFEVEKKLPSNLFQTLFTGSRAVSDAFDKHSISLYSSCYGFGAENLHKFMAGDSMTTNGSYYTAYMDRIEKLLEGTFKEVVSSVSPHLDKRWHLPAYMADLNTTRMANDKDKLNRAFIKGLLYKALYTGLTNDGAKCWYYSTPNTNEGRILVNINSERIKPSVYGMYSAMSYNPGFIDKINRVSSEMLIEERDEHSDSHTKYTFYKNLTKSGFDDKNILDAILSYPSGMPSDKTAYDTLENVILPTFLDVLSHELTVLFGEQRQNMVAEKFSNIIKKLVTESEILKKADKKSAAYMSWMKIIDNYKPSKGN